MVTTVFDFPERLRTETYSEHCDRLEETVKNIILSGDTSEHNLNTLARVLMVAPSDFDYVSEYFPFRQSREFLRAQSDEVRERFRELCLKSPQRHEPRIRWLLHKPT